MSRKVVIGLVLLLGVGIGSLVPAATSWWQARARSGITVQEINSATALTNEGVSSTNHYHFSLKNGVLSVIEGMPGASGKVILTGLEVQAWPKEILEMATKVDFYSLDEVQSFIDTATEPLWQE